VDNDDILKRRNEFVGQVNNVLCFFIKLKYSVVYKLFQSYCMSLHALCCELGSQQHSHRSSVRLMAKKFAKSLKVAVQNSLLFAAFLSESLCLEDEICIGGHYAFYANAYLTGHN